ncbi:MAG: rhomboid family intramembrane serine protease [Bacteroidota bacterium]
MIPLHDSIPSRTVPVVNYLLIIANVVIFLFELSLGHHLQRFIAATAFVPAAFTMSVYQNNITLSTFTPVLVSMFLHGGWFHLGGNMLFLWIFGDNVEDSMGHFRYLIFYLLSGVGAAAIYYIVNPISQEPIIGASGAIAGVLGAYFLLYPWSRVLTWFPMFIFFVVEIPAVVFLGIWFILQMYSGLLSLETGTAGGIAWWAHVGGFIVGGTLIGFFKKRGYYFFWQQ